MADFSYLSDSNDAEVEEILAQAMDQSILEQVASINCSGFSDSVLSTDLETRFRKLKSFPVTNQKQRTEGNSFLSSNSMKREEPTSFNSQVKIPTSSFNEATTDTQSQEQSQSSNKEGKGSPDLFSDEENMFSASKKSSKKKGLKSKSKSKSGSTASSPSASSDSSEALSPPRQKCWFWCSPKKVSRRKDKQKKSVESLLDTLDWGKDDELLSDLSMFSVKDQQKKLKKALKEEEKVAREAKKVVEWARQASARMNVSMTPDVSSDDERFK